MTEFPHVVCVYRDGRKLMSNGQIFTQAGINAASEKCMTEVGHPPQSEAAGGVNPIPCVECANRTCCIPAYVLNVWAVGDCQSAK